MRNWNLHMLLVVCKIVLPFWKTVWQFLKKLNIVLPYMTQQLHS